MHKNITYFFIISIFIFIVYISTGKYVTPTMQYFPIDEQITFEQAETTLNMNKDIQKVVWNVNSTSSEKAYLRQDVSLLYDNGKIKGVLSKWREQTKRIELVNYFPIGRSGLLQAISFHHAEIHRGNDINSIQQMTQAKLHYVEDENTLFSFHTPHSPKEKEWKKVLHKQMDKQLKIHWDDLTQHLHINQEEYLLIPLTELDQYEDKTFPNRSEEETKQIIGQLWEGLYKNYIISFSENENRNSESYIPLIMLAHDNSHLLVVYELNGQKQKLLQKLP